MPTPCSAGSLLDREFLAARCRLIDLAAMLDRIDRAEGTVAGDPRIESIRRSLEVLRGDGPERAERIQHLFSRPYDEAWRAT